ncbi:MAG: hypothetical protein U5K43_07015 [Halofilum sp. (in: g-proteobacteria)]|nr:hypothetical protein [Halofilum sp. (in: g-proteobacteria)]
MAATASASTGRARRRSSSAPRPATSMTSARWVGSAKPASAA